MRLIDADELVKKWEEMLPIMVPDEDGKHPVSLEKAIEKLKDAPTIDAVLVRHGKWKGWHGDKLVGVTEDGKDVYRHYHYYECSECHRRTAVKSNYCPSCGAKMDGE